MGALLTLKEAAKRLRIGERTLYRLMTEGEINFGAKVGDRWRFDSDDIEAYLARKKDEARGNAG